MRYACECGYDTLDAKAYAEHRKTCVGKKPQPNLWHQTGVTRTGEPFVQLVMTKEKGDELMGQFTPDEARDHAYAMLAAAEAAEGDAFLTKFLTKDMGLPLEQAARVLVAFREWREKRTGIKTGMTFIPTDERSQA